MILIVEDDERLSRFLAAAFKRMNWPCTMAQNGVDAYRLVHEKDRQCLLLDMRMPMLDGMEFLRVMKREGINVPTIVMTGQDDFDVKTLEAFPNVVGFVGKPFTIEDVVEMVLPHMTSALRTAGAADRLRANRPPGPPAGPRLPPRTWRK